MAPWNVAIIYRSFCELRLGHSGRTRRSFEYFSPESTLDVQLPDRKPLAYSVRIAPASVKIGMFSPEIYYFVSRCQRLYKTTLLVRLTQIESKHIPTNSSAITRYGRQHTQGCWGSNRQAYPERIQTAYMGDPARVRTLGEVSPTIALEILLKNDGNKSKTQ